MGHTQTMKMNPMAFGAGCCCAINLILAYIAFLFPALVSNANNKSPKLYIGVWAACSTWFNPSTGATGDDAQCFGWADNRVAYGTFGGVNQSLFGYFDGDKFFINPTNIYRSNTDTPNHISVTMGLYTTAIVLLSLGSYTACGAC